MTLFHRWQTRLQEAFKIFKESRLYNIIGALLVVLLIGTAGFRFTEGWAWGDAFYATVITTTTIGYGDLTPVTPLGRLFAIVYAIVAIGVVGYAISRLATVVISTRRSRQESRHMEQKMRNLANLKGHVIVCGATVLAQYVLYELLTHKHQIVAMAHDEEALRKMLLEVLSLKDSEGQASHFMRLEHFGGHEGDDRSLDQLAETLGVQCLVANPMQSGSLLAAGITEAKALMSVLEDDRDNLLVVLTAHEIDRRMGQGELVITTRATEDENVSKLKMAGATHVFAANSVAGLRMVMTIAEPIVSDYWQMMTAEQGVILQTLDVTKDGLAGQTVGQITAVYPLVIVALKRGDSYENIPSANTAVENGDILITFAKKN